MVREHGLVAFRISPDAACASAFGRDFPLYKETSREGYEKQRAIGSTWLVCDLWMLRPCLSIRSCALGGDLWV